MLSVAMGAWGPGPFDNDAAVEFLDMLRASPSRLVTKVRTNGKKRLCRSITESLTRSRNQALGTPKATIRSRTRKPSSRRRPKVTRNSVRS
jgi:hypothetical protein